MKIIESGSFDNFHLESIRLFQIQKPLRELINSSSSAESKNITVDLNIELSLDNNESETSEIENILFGNNIDKKKQIKFTNK